MDYTTTKQRLGNHYVSPFEKVAPVVAFAGVIVFIAFLGIAKFTETLNAHAQTRQQKMEAIKATIANDTHIKSFHAEIIYQ